MRLSEIFKDIDHKTILGGDAEITGLSIDSRAVTPGDLFFCIKGPNVDRHIYINDVIKKGAAAIVAEREAETPDVPAVFVTSSRKALNAAANVFYDYPSKKINLYGVTGTNGKTSVTYLTEAIFANAGRKTGVIGSLRAHVSGATSTTPDTPELYKTLDEMRKDGVTDVFMEVSSHSLALYKTDGLNFRASAFTNLTRDHLDFHLTMDAYKSAKKRLFGLCDTMVINADDAASFEMAAGESCGIIAYGIENECGLRAEKIVLNGNAVSFETSVYNERIKFEIPIPVRFAVYNALAAIGIAVTRNIPAENMVNGLKNVRVRGRFQFVPNDKSIKVIIDYAHTPDALKNILESARAFFSGRMITVFGCGGDRDRAKRPMMGKIAGELSDYCIITSDNPRSEEPMEIIYEIEKGISRTNCDYEIICDRKSAIREAIRAAKNGDAVIIAGKGHENYQELKDRTIYFDDYETAEEALGELPGIKL